MIDNSHLIKPILNFEKEGDFYMLSVFKRKKDQPDEDKENHQSVRTIKTYTISSVSYLEKKLDEVKKLCELFKARAYINVQKQNHNDISLEMIKTIVDRVKSGQINQQHVFDRVVGSVKSYEKRWVVDIDSKDNELISNIKKYIDSIRPEGPKIETEVPTKAGCHLITKRFDLKKFNKKYPEVEVKKKNPTLLFLPDSLD